MNDLATLTGQPKRLTIEGRTYRLFPQTMATLGAFQCWIDAQTKDPEESICESLDEFEPAVQKFLATKAADRAERGRTLVGTPEAQQMAYTMGGICELLYLSVRQGRRFSRKRAQALYWKLSTYGRRLVLGTMWEGAPRVRDDDDGPPMPNFSFDWWRLFNRLTHEPHWFSISDIKRMTWAQVVCLSGDGEYEQSITNAVQYQAAIAAEQAPLWTS